MFGVNRKVRGTRCAYVRNVRLTGAVRDARPAAAQPIHSIKAPSLQEPGGAHWRSDVIPGAFAMSSSICFMSLCSAGFSVVLQHLIVF